MESGGIIPGINPVDSGKSRLLVNETLAMNNSTGEVDPRRLQRTILPIPREILAGIDEDGNTIPPDMTIIEKQLELYSLLIEYSQTPEYCPPGVYCMPSWKNLREWDGFLFIHQGLYRGGIFKFKIRISEDYPQVAPECFFISNVFHPLVDEKSGMIGVEAEFHQWDSEKDYLPMLLLFLKALFYNIDLISGTEKDFLWKNVNAAKAFRYDKEGMLQKIRDCVTESQKKVYAHTNDFVFTFTEYHREKKPIVQALNVLSHDMTCVDPKEAFVEWFLDDWCQSEFDSKKLERSNSLLESSSTKKLA